MKEKKSKAIKRRRKVVKTRRRGGYGGRRRTARKVESDEELPFTPRERQQYIKGNRILIKPLEFHMSTYTG